MVVNAGLRPTGEDAVHEPLTTKEGWRRFVDAAQDPPAGEDTDESSTRAERQQREQERLDYHGRLPVVATPTVREVTLTGRRLMVLNRHQISARRGLIVTGAAGTGKTTAITQLGRAHELGQRLRLPADASRLPVVYVTVPPAATPRMLAVEFARFLGLPIATRANLTDVTDAVCGVLGACGCQLVIVDEIHNLNLATRSGAEASDQLKYFSERLPATFLYAGIEVARAGLFAGTRGAQIAGRFATITTSPFPYGTAEQRRNWQALVGTIEQSLRLRGEDHPHRPGRRPTRPSRRAPAPRSHPAAQGRKQAATGSRGRMTTVRPLPVPVPLVHGETLDSYLHRLAAANHLDARDLRVALGMRTRTRPPDLDHPAVITGYPPQRLADVLADARPPPGRDRLYPRTGRPACRRCTARRGITSDVLCVDVDHYVCRRHRRWLGSPLEQATDQHDLTALPEVLHAQRRHHRLLRRHGTDPARTAIYWATTIVDGWTTRGTWGERRTSRLARLPHGTNLHAPDGSVLRIVNYPEVVTLADLLASEHWRTIASADYRRDRWPFDREVARRLGLNVIGFASDDPLVSWQEGQALARRRRLHQQPGYRGPEVWLSLAGELYYEPVPRTKWPS